MYSDDTIAALSTPFGTGGIGVIRISGSSAFSIAEKFFLSSKKMEDIKSHTVNYGKIIDPISKEVIDEVLLLKMKKPNTFTREDVIEIHCHGGIVVIDNVLTLLYKNGARPAEPGEFTKRAFLNGRIDLSQAEGIIDLINAKTKQSSKAAVNHIEGKLSKRLRESREKLIELLAHIDVTVDYPEHDIEEITGEKVYEGITEIKKELIRLSDTFSRGRILREGINIVIAGKPNVGKSSLLNQLSGETKAIVTDIPGTTRDTIEEYINIRGIPAKITDTAGIRETEDVVEKIGVDKARKAMDEADLIILMVAANNGLTQEDELLIKEIQDRKHLVLINKTDLASEDQLNLLVSSIEKVTSGKILKASVKEDVGVEDLEDSVANMFFKGSLSQNDEVLITNIRHKSLVDKAITEIDQAIEAYNFGMPLDMVTIDIKNAADSIGQITGESISEAVMHNIFSRFCLGK